MDNIGRRDFLKAGTGLVTGITTASPSGEPRKGGTSEAIPPAGPMKLDVNERGLRLRAGWCEIPDWRLALEADGELLEATDAKVEIVRAEPLRVRFHLKRQLTWEIEAETDPAANRLILRSTISNESQKPIALGKAVLLHSEKLTGFSTSGDDLVYLPMSSGQGLNEVRAIKALICCQRYRNSNL